MKLTHVEALLYAMTAAIEKAIKTDNTVFIDFRVEQEENVFPMVPAGEAINKIIGGLA